MTPDERRDVRAQMHRMGCAVVERAYANALARGKRMKLAAAPLADCGLMAALRTIRYVERQRRTGT